MRKYSYHEKSYTVCLFPYIKSKVETALRSSVVDFVQTMSFAT